MQQIHTNEHSYITRLTLTTAESRALVDKRSNIKLSEEEDWEVVDDDGQLHDGEEQQNAEQETPVDAVSPEEQVVGEEHQQDVTSFVFVSPFVRHRSSLEVLQNRNRTPSQETPTTSVAVEQNEPTNQDKESTVAIGNTDDDGTTLRADASYQLFQEEQRARHSVLIEHSNGNSSSLFWQESHQLRVRMQIAMDEALAKDMRQKAADRYTAAKEIALVNSETSKYPKKSQQSKINTAG